jgi:putative nucleotidyltransferase with HDIG domain
MSTTTVTPRARASEPHAVRAVVGQAHAVYVPVDLDGLVPDTVLEFALHFQSAPGYFVPLQGAGAEFSSVHVQRLRESGVTTLWVADADHHLYEGHVERHLSTLLAAHRAPARKAALLYSAARTTLASVLADPRHTDAAPRTRGVAEELARWLASEPGAIGYMGALMARDYDTVRHSINVSVFATSLAVAAGVRDREHLQDFTHGALLHDVGKSRIPRELITKPGAFTDAELALMRTHVSEGEHILRRDGRLPALAMVAVSQHHERMDGGGYPRRTSGEDLHLFGRISAICDVYDALTSDRSYKRAIPGADALKLMGTHMAAHFDQALLRTFIRTLRGTGTRPAGLGRVA